MNTDQPTQAQRLVPVKRALGHPVRLLPYETVEDLIITDDNVAIRLTTYETTETTREVRFQRRGLKTLWWRKLPLESHPAILVWKQQPTMIVWDDTFKPYVECRYGRHISVEESRERAEWEANTYRPGSSRQPMDSFTRSVEVLPSERTDKMYRYWTGHSATLGYTTESNPTTEK